ncbi:helix-turn-helix transcriptional regulator [Pseudophaeobacter arcticus]|uniref:helix-turn-helix transcriptional regulator n=1 Tax=Pseudophaeobacter arcticus TaxID=385492 RepID=UPI0006890DFF|nr:helix-turn-helix transcriptional regulator [Pseudophaeobacter arcticus]
MALVSPAKGQMEMEEFTYSGLVALLAQAIADRAPDLLEGTAIADPMKGALADARHKASLVQRVMDRHGAGLLLEVGQYLDRAADTPALTVMKRSATPRILAEKFMRLERYHHSSHRTSIETGSGVWHCVRSSRQSPPTPGENCLIAGLLLGLVMAIGQEDCQLEIGGKSFAPQDLPAATFAPGAETAHFRITWAPSIKPGDQEPPLLPNVEDACLSDRLAALFETDLGRSWKISDAARLLALSERSMQRHLGAEAHSHSSVLRRVRMKAATLYLVETDTSLAEIGYCCGYADQAHFQRDFLRTANVTPRQFRLVNQEADSLI